MARIKYAQLGTEHAHANKIRVYRESQDYEVVGVAEPNPKLRAGLANNPLYRDLPILEVPQLLNIPGLQVVGVETAVRDQMNYAQKCIEAGVHLHLEKPGGSSLPAFRKLMNDAAMKHCIVQLGYMYRYNPAIVLLRDLLKRGWLGDVFEVHAVMSKLSPQPLRDEVAEFKGGTMFELGCHLIDLLQNILGTADSIHAFPRHSANNPDKLMDNMLAVFEYPRATATVRTSLVEVDGFARRQLAVVGTKGTLHIQPLDNPKAELTLSEARGKYKKGRQDISFPRYSRYVGDADDLAKCVRHEKDPDFGYEHDINVMSAVLQASDMPAG